MMGPVHLNHLTPMVFAFSPRMGPSFVPRSDLPQICLNHPLSQRLSADSNLLVLPELLGRQGGAKTPIIGLQKLKDLALPGFRDFARGGSASASVNNGYIALFSDSFHQAPEMTIRHSHQIGTFLLGQLMIKHAMKNAKSLHFCPAHLNQLLAHSALLGTLCTPRRDFSHLSETGHFHFAQTGHYHFAATSLVLFLTQGLPFRILISSERASKACFGASSQLRSIS
jgi:hypothetical protein